ncbi:FHA domain-containing protein [Nannocystis pusilla]|uniref:FHA domain-containing protein n=1 Tax=Nannocystis pusilla TaxID=889268 RepID=A0A9X3J3C2_9BACT|nr:FHA domain-containing protein [Nannocystis pusilla]MCY1013075.1 FHA domain-containing protein [Nannocystis pusilla]
MGVLSFTVVDHQTRNVVFNRRFDRFPVRIGRHEDNDVRLDYPFVSRWHAEVRQDPAGGYFSTRSPSTTASPSPPRGWMPGPRCRSPAG